MSTLSYRLKSKAMLAGLLIAILSVGLVGVSQAEALVISKISDNPKKHYERLKPIVDYMASHMSDLGITEGKVLLAKDNAQMVRYLRQGKVDWVTETAFSAVVFEEQAGAEIILRKWKKGEPEYRSVFIARKDSTINSIDDLRGRLVAFEDPGSTSAYFLPSTVLVRRGMSLVQLDNIKESIPEGKVGFVFSGEERNTATWVHKGLVDAGAISNSDWEKLTRMPEAFRKDLHLIHETPAIPRALELVRQDLDPRITARLKSLLLGAAEDPEADEVLSAYEGATAFDEVDLAMQESLSEVRALLKVITSALE